MEAVVSHFDAARGDGWVLAENGRRYYFHCVTILDGTRIVEGSSTVRVHRMVGHLGRDEVTNVEKLK